MGRADILNRAFVMVSVMVCVLSCDNTTIPEFDRSRAFADLEQQVAFGPRVPGTKAHEQTRDWITEQMRSCTSHVAVQKFRDVFAGKETDMYNIIASFQPDKQNRVLLCAHWDCRPYADKDPDTSLHMRPVPGANDGASGVAVLLEIARVIKDHEPSVGIDFAFFDGEDGGDYGNNETWLLGSRHFAKVMPSSYQPKYAILLDMIGDKHLSLSRDYHSADSAPFLWAKIQKLCETIGIPISAETRGIIDDHIPLIERGIPAVDLIDFDYPSWHTVSDTPDKCSADSLGKIGTLVLTIVYGE